MRLPAQCGRNKSHPSRDWAESAWGALLFKMKYTITINQFANFASGLGLDLIDLALFDFVRSFVQSGKCECASMGGKPYFWISPQLVIEEMPILGITSTRGINMRIENLIGAGLLVRGEENKSKHKTFVAFGPRVSDYEFVAWNESSKSLGTNLPSNKDISNQEKTYISGGNGEIPERLFEDDKDCPTEAANETQKSTSCEGAKSKEERMKERAERFRAECYGFAGEFGTQMVEDFILYWTEPNKSKTAMRFELQRTWDTHRRMLTWSRNNFNKYNRNQPTSQPSADRSAEEALRAAGWI